MSKPLNVFEAPLSGISLVEASAGTGKTYSITSLYIRAILERDFTPSQTLVVTFTEAATAELKFRIRNRIKESIKALKEGDSGGDEFLKALLKQKYPDADVKLKNALDLFDEAAIFTIHGFCNRVLNEHSLQFDVSPGFEVIRDEAEILQDCADEYWRKYIRSSHNSKEDQILLEYLIDEGFSPDELTIIVKEIINRPFATLEPSDFTLDEIKNHLKKLIFKFEEIKYYWGEEEEELLAILNHEKLNKSKYGENKKEEWLKELTGCLNDPLPKVKPFDHLYKFGVDISHSGNAGHIYPELKISKAIDEYLQICDELASLKPAFVIDSVEEIKKELIRRKDLANVLSYNDFLLKVDKGLQSDTTGKLASIFREMYPMALVDEFQDTDPTQYNIFRQIYQGSNNTALYMIGDPKQAIYGFRGADIYTYLKAKGDAEETQTYTLNHNYRSNDKMISAVNEIFQQSQHPFLIEGVQFEKAEFPPSKTENNYLLDKNGDVVNPLQCIKIEQEKKAIKSEVEEQVATAVTDEILEILTGDFSIKGMPVLEKDIAVLVRNGYQGENIQQKLRERGIKSVLKSKTSVFKTAEADDLYLILKSLQKLSYEPGIRAALATELLGFSAANIHALLEEERNWAARYNKFVQLKEVWEKKGIDRVIQQIFQVFEIKNNLASMPDSERRITNLLHLSDLLSKAEREEKLYGKSLLKWFYRKMMEDSSTSEEEELRLESDGDLIQISTIHAAKGLEYPITLCPFLWDAPKSKNKNEIYRYYKDEKVHVDIHTGSKKEQRLEHKLYDLQEEMAEATRLAYVALTRSECACYLFLTDYETLELSPIASVLDGKEQAEFRARKKITGEDRGVDFSEDQLFQKLSANENIIVREPVSPQGQAKKEKRQETEVAYKAANFSRNDLFRFPRMLSYSSLSFHTVQEETAHDYDAVFQPVSPTPVKYTRFNFPKGANAGTCLHKIFEDLTFNNVGNIEKIVADNLELHGFSEKWGPIVKIWTDEVLKHNLKVPQTSLNALNKEDLLKEMEFHFPVENLQVNELWKLVRNKPDMEILRNEKVSGFMKGFIDLTFRYGDKYYILDYKSNYLGDSPEDYSDQALKEEVLNSAYDLQYHIYTTALHRFLKHKLKKYDYLQHFGGVLYVFLRGVDLNRAGSGIFFDKPEKQLIENLDYYFKSGGMQ